MGVSVHTGSMTLHEHRMRKKAKIMWHLQTQRKAELRERLNDKDYHHIRVFHLEPYSARSGNIV